MLFDENLEQKKDPIAEDMFVAMPNINNDDKGKLKMVTEIMPVKLVTVIKPSAYNDRAIRKWNKLLWFFLKLIALLPTFFIEWENLEKVRLTVLVFDLSFRSGIEKKKIQAPTNGPTMRTCW